MLHLFLYLFILFFNKLAFFLLIDVFYFVLFCVVSFHLVSFRCGTFVLVLLVVSLTQAAQMSGGIQFVYEQSRTHAHTHFARSLPALAHINALHKHVSLTTITCTGTRIDTRIGIRTHTHKHSLTHTQMLSLGPSFEQLNNIQKVNVLNNNHSNKDGSKATITKTKKTKKTTNTACKRRTPDIIFF